MPRRSGEPVTAHSPGPWTWETCDGDDSLVDAEGRPVFEGEWVCQADNARLIAAAPELLALLTEYARWFEVNDLERDERADALIARIDGKEPP